MKKEELLFCPLGGSGEIGMNMNLFGYGLPGDHKWIMVDIGVTFADDTYPGIDLIYPDPGFITDKKEDLLGIVLTHAHEDHIGAIPYVISRVNVPIYSSNLTNSLISSKLKAHGLLKESTLNIIDPEIPFFFGKFEITFFRVCHSIPDSMGIAISTELGTLIHTGDFKVDYTPQDGLATDF